MIKKMFIVCALALTSWAYGAELARLKARSQAKSEQGGVHVDSAKKTVAAGQGYNAKQLKFIEDMYNPNITEEQRSQNLKKNVYPHLYFQQVIRKYHADEVQKSYILAKSDFVFGEVTRYAECEKYKQEHTASIDWEKVQEEYYIIGINNQLIHQQMRRNAKRTQPEGLVEPELAENFLSILYCQ